MNKKRLFEQLKVDEGVKYEIYKDHLGYPTFGIGHLVTDKDPENGQPVGTKISKDRVKSAFDNDIKVAIKEAKTLYGSHFNSWPNEVQETVVNMVFNMGRPRLSGFKKFKAALIAEDWKTAAVEMRDSRWYRQVTNRAERLAKTIEKLSD